MNAEDKTSAIANAATAALHAFTKLSLRTRTSPALPRDRLLWPFYASLHLSPACSPAYPVTKSPRFKRKGLHTATGVYDAHTFSVKHFTPEQRLFFT